MIWFCVLLYLLIGFVLYSFIHYKDTGYGAISMFLIIFRPLMFPIWAIIFYDLSVFNWTDVFWRWIHYNWKKEENE